MESKFYGTPLAAWLTTVALVLIVIGVALTLAAWKSHKKKTQADVTQIMTVKQLETMLEPSAGQLLLTIPSQDSAYCTKRFTWGLSELLVTAKSLLPISSACWMLTDGKR